MEIKRFNRVACYLRVSTENQLENYSIDEQTTRLKAYCLAKNWNIYKFYTDGGYSGGNTDRPALKKMLKDIKAGKIDMVVVYKLDRLSRSQKDTLTLIEDEFISHDVEFVSMSENFDTSTPFGRAMIGILSVFAQLEKDQITERFTMGRIGRAKAGKYHGSSFVPLGYDYAEGELVINEYEAMQVREVFDMFLKGYAILAIRNHMKQKLYKTKRKNWSSETAVRSCLMNNIYIGKVRFNGVSYDGTHEPIIPDDIFYQAQQKFKERETSITGHRKTPFKAMYLLSNSLICARCKAKYSANHGYYKCYSRSKSTGKFVKDPNCKNENWNIEELDEIVKSEIIKLKIDDNYLKEIISESKDDNNIEDTDIKVNRISEIETQITRMLDLYQVGSIPMEQITKRVNQLQDEKESLKHSLDIPIVKKQTLTDIKKILAQYDTVFNNGSIEEQRTFVTTLIDFIEIDGRTLKFHWKI
jgi:site-specific DNA recombinase